MHTGARLWCVRSTHADRAHTHAHTHTLHLKNQLLLNETYFGWEKKSPFIPLPLNPLARRLTAACSRSVNALGAAVPAPEVQTAQRLSLKLGICVLQPRCET